MLIVEDGTVINGANAYITVAELDSYWLSRNVTLQQTESEKEAAIIISTQYVDNNFNWRGSIITEEQVLDWPRSGVYDDEGRGVDNDEIPLKLKNAICEYAKRQLEMEIQPDVFPDDKGVITSERSKVDVIEEQITYKDGGYYGMRRYPLADNYLKGLTTGGTMGSFGELKRGGYYGA